MRWFGKKTFEDIEPQVPFNELKKRVRILVIDDDKNSFPLKLFQDEGYAVDYWAHVESVEKLQRGDYDIIILDIGGVAEQWGPEDGLEILEHLKKVNPSQVVVAFSGRSFDLSKNRFWKLADDSLAKPVNAAKCKRMIDRLIKDKLTVNHFWQTILPVLQEDGLTQHQTDRIERKLVKALLRKDKKSVESLLTSAAQKAETVAILGRLAVKLLWLFGIS